MWRNITCDGLVIGESAAILWLLWGIWTQGWQRVYEPNLVIRIVETAIFLFALGFGIYKFIHDIRKV